MAGAGTLSEPAVSRPRSEGLCKQEVWALWVRELLLGWATLLEKAEGQTRRCIFTACNWPSTYLLEPMGSQEPNPGFLCLRNKWKPAEIGGLPISLHLMH